MDYAASAGARVNGWSPLRAPGLLGWWETTFGVSPLSGTLSKVADRSGHGYDMFAQSGAEPAYSPTSWKGDRPGLSFTPTQYLKTENSAIAGYVNGTSIPVTVLQVADTPSSGSRQYMTAWGDGSGVGAFEVYVTGGLLTVDVSSGGGGAVGGAQQILGRQTHVISFDGATLTTYVNGLIDLDHVTFGGALSGSARLSFGTNAPGSNGFGGVLSEFAVYNRGWTAPEVAAFHDYAVRKWGL